MRRNDRMMIGGGRRGFTLVELLISIALTVFILSLFATLFASGNNAVRSARGSSQADQSVQSSLTIIRRDLDHVYLGEGISLGSAFSSPDQIPSAGYFTLEENMPASPPFYMADQTLSNSISNTKTKTLVQAIQGYAAMNPTGYSGNANPTVLYREGVDERGLPVEVDVDDVLAFTVRLPGDSQQNIFTGRVPKSSVLDNELNPGGRFDLPDNGLFTSPMAEVIYFLRPDRNYQLREINRPALGSDDGRQNSIPTYTLYRRELLLLSEQQRNDVETLFTDTVANGGRAYGSASIVAGELSNSTIQSQNPQITANPSYYQLYDVSASYSTSAGQLRFNDSRSIRQRQNRYGMAWASTSAVPPDAFGPFYDHVAGGTATNQLRLFVPGAGLNWHGRPTLFESTLVGSEGLADVNYNPVTSGKYATWGFSSLNYTTATTTNHRKDNDVFLRNVLSFDVKVLNDDTLQGTSTLPIRSDQSTTITTYPSDFAPGALIPRSPGDLEDWPAARTSLLAALDSYTNTSRPGVFASNPSRPVNHPTFGLAALANVQPEFVDLGMTLTSELQANFTNTSATSIAEARPVIDQTQLTNGNSITSGLFQSGGSNPYHVPWGTHTPARWVSTGRREAWSSQTSTNFPLYSVYDTWAPEYQPAAYINILAGGTATAYLPPYDRPLRGIQITIRVLEPRSGVVREFQIVHEFN